MTINRVPARAGRGRSLGAVAGVMGLMSVLVGCAEDERKSTLSDQVRAVTPFDDLLTPSVRITQGEGRSLRNGSTDVVPGSLVTVTAVNGRLLGVDVSGGDPVGGVIAPDGRSWTSSRAFGYGQDYRIDARASGVGGVATGRVGFTTSTPSVVTNARLTPDDGATVGVGQPVALTFDEPIADKQAAQRAIRVTADPPVEGAWYWLSATEARWRPAQYWKPGTKVTVTVDTRGHDLGDGIFGDDSYTKRFTVGRSLIASVDDATKVITVTRDGTVVRRMPTSMGKPSAPTNPGTYLVGERLDHIVMDSSTYGVPVNSADGYRTPVDYATQLSYSGIYVHSAPWSVWAQGNTNTSHGCLNVSPEDALWFLRTTLRGDVVEVRGTAAETLPGDDGLGDWNVPWDRWRAGNA
ncbi:L,D-transpeptidase [Williamsia sterculiae]|uniref:Lipoprotein-anchoring transpeptidase ErfK/SrfK n=1 Tax=Williamsia sterculiae TaxID=1344003 RepID=A0A1N7GKT6_9NOCA|nr:Ig-like domain-containing protein [Williamsia sterculiae]SIS13126.1 Lipoprotein-anchoring transpeptidase ErfK/SrfK [Williamsia sterculiae]